MPIEVQLPDGSVVEFPDGTSNDTMKQALRKYAAPKAPSGGFGRGMGLGLRNVVEGVTDVLGIAGNPVNMAVSTLAGKEDAKLSDLITGQKRDRIPYQTMTQAAGSLLDRAGVPRPESAQERVVGDIGRAISGTGLTMGAGALAGPSSRVGSALAADPGMQVAASVVGPGAAGITRESGGGEGAQLAAGLLGAMTPGAARYGVPAAASSIGGPVARMIGGPIRPEIREVYEAAKARGINLTPAQLSDSKMMKLLSGQLGILPGSGAAAKSDAQIAAINRQLASVIGENAPIITPKVYNAAKQRHSQQFDELTARNELKVTPKLMADLQTIAKNAKAAGGDVAQGTQAAIEDFIGRIQQGQSGPVVPGTSYQQLDTALGQTTKMGTPVSHFVGQVKHQIRGAMDASISPADRAAWKRLRTEYGDRKTLRNLVAAASGGPLPPAQLLGRTSSNNWGKEAMATGQRGELGTLADIGQAMKPVRSSGTAENTAANSILNPFNALATAGRFAGGATVGRALNSDFLARLMMGEGGVSPNLAQALERWKMQQAMLQAQQSAQLGNQ